MGEQGGALIVRVRRELVVGHRLRPALAAVQASCPCRRGHDVGRGAHETMCPVGWKLGDSAALEQPESLVAQVRGFFRLVR